MNTIDILCAKARLNAAVFRARRELYAARAGSYVVRREMRGVGNHPMLREPPETRAARAAKAMEREVAAEEALSVAVEAWARDATRLTREFRASLPERWRSNAAPVGVTFDEAFATLRARFGEPDATHPRAEGVPRGARWTRDVWTTAAENHPSVCAARCHFGLCEDGADKRHDRVRIYGHASTWGRFALGEGMVEVIVGAEPRLSWDIEHTWLGNVGDELRCADPGPYRERPTAPWALAAWTKTETEDRERWIPWAFDAPETAEGLMRASGSGPPHIAPLALAVEAVARMITIAESAKSAEGSTG